MCLNGAEGCYRYLTAVQDFNIEKLFAIELLERNQSNYILLSLVQGRSSLEVASIRA
jgi:hypothetical protein